RRPTYFLWLVLPTILMVGAVLVTGQQPPAAGQAVGSGGDGGRGAAAPAQGRGRGRAAAPPRTGVTVPGEGKNYLPVTDAMLSNPDPNEWLISRRTYSAWDYSPLSQITRDNVPELRLQWVWAMNECGVSGRNQPAPIVHGGVMYLLNCGHVLQALDARSGDLIWEHNLAIPSTTA